MPRPLSIDGDRAVDVDRDVDLIAEAGQRLVDRVVDDLVDQVMQAGGPGRADVHRRPLADGLEPFEDLDLVGAVVVVAPWPPWPLLPLEASPVASPAGTSTRRRLFVRSVLVGMFHSGIQTRIGMIT